MVGRYIIEDEYTVNVRLLRDANIATYPNDPPLPLVTINRSKPTHCARDEVPYRGITHYYNSNSSSPTFILECNEPYTLVRTDQNCDSTVTSRNSSPTITLLPPLDSHITSVNVTHHYNGVPENANIIVQGRNLGRSSECSVHHRIQSGLEPGIIQRSDRRTVSDRYSVIQSNGAHKEVTSGNLSSESLQHKPKKKSQMNMLLIASENSHNNDLKDIDCLSSRRNSLNKSSKCYDSPAQFMHNSGTKLPNRPLSFIDEKINAGLLEELPSVHVFADDNTLVSKNSYARPKSDNDHFYGDSKPVGPGSLFVKPIKQHCSQGNGQLYVAPVDYQALLAKQIKHIAPLKGNSRRKRGGNGSNATTTNTASPLKKYPLCQKNLPQSGVSLSISPPCDVDWDENEAQNVRNCESGENYHSKSYLKAMQEWSDYDISDNELVDRRVMLHKYQCHQDRIGITSFTSIPPTSSSRYSSNTYSSKTSPNSIRDIKENDYGESNLNVSFRKSNLDIEANRREAPQDRRKSKEFNSIIGNQDFRDGIRSRNGPYNSYSPSKADARALITEIISDRLATFLTVEQSNNEENNNTKLNESKSTQNLNNSKFNKCVKMTRNGVTHSLSEVPNKSRRPVRMNHENLIRNDEEEPSVARRVRVPEKEVRRNRVHFPGDSKSPTENQDCGAFTNGQGINDTREHLANRSLKSDNRQTWPHFLAKSENMIVTKEPVIPSHMQLPSCNNNHMREFSIGNPYLINERARKYLIDDSHTQYGGHSNLAYDSHDNLEFDQGFGFSSYGDICPFDPGYGSERSEEEESNSLPKESFCSPPSLERSPPKNIMSTSLMPLKGIDLSVDYLMGLFPFINEGTVFEVTIVRNSRGLGLSVTGGVECETLPLPGLIRVKKLYPQTPAWLCGQLQLDDFLLEANGNQLTGLTSHEALEVLRTTGCEVHLVVCRAREILMEGGDDNLTHVDRRGHSMFSSTTDPHFNFNYHQLSPSSSFSNCGEFEIKLQKVAGSLGFTLRKNDNSILGHTIRSLVKEPAISDGRIRPGDKLVSVNGTDMCGVSHEEAVRFLRTCPDDVVIRLYRDAMQTPVSPASPAEPDLFAPPKQLRKEARDMLSDLAFRKQSSPNSTGNTTTDSLPSSRRRRFNKTPSPESNKGAVNRWESLVKEAENSDSNNSDDASTIVNNDLSMRNERLESTGNSYRANSESSPNVSPSNSSCSESRPSRPNFLDLSNSHSSSRKSRFTPPHEENALFPSPPTSRQYESLDSVPQLTSTHSDTPAFSHLQPGYRSVNLSAINPYSEQHLTNTSSDHNIHGYKAESPPMNNTLLKWKGVLFTPDDDEESKNENFSPDLSYPTSSTDEISSTESVKQKIVTIDLHRGWNSRLGFSLRGNGEQTTVIAIYDDSVAAKDGRLKVGDIVLEINDTDVQSWSTESVIDHLRKIKGKVFLKVIQNLP